MKQLFNKRILCHLPYAIIGSAIFSITALTAYGWLAFAWSVWMCFMCMFIGYFTGRTDELKDQADELRRQR